MSAVLSVIAVFYFILIYRVIDEKEKKDKKGNAVILALSVLLTVAAAIYFVAFSKSTIAYDLDGFCSELARRGAENGHPELVRPSYYTYKLYNNFTNDVWYFGKYYTEYPIEHYFPTLSKYIPEAAGTAICGVLNIITLHIKAAYGMRADFFQIVGKAAVIMLPIDAFLVGFWIYMAKRAKNIIRKILFVFMVFQMPLLFVSCSLASLDWGRWIIVGFITNFTCLLYVLFKEKGSIDYVEKVISFFRLRCIIPYLIVYSSVVFYVYVL